MVTNICWYGTQQESLELIAAIGRNCSCEFGALGIRLRVCPPHEMLSSDQRALNGLLFSRRMARRLLAEEFLMTRKPAIEA
jgi:hypothetical protein